MSRNVGLLVPDAAAVNATTIRLHALLDRERRIIDDLIGQRDEATRVRARRTVEELVTEMGVCLAGHGGSVAPPAGFAGAINARFAAVRAAGSDASSPVGETARQPGTAITRFNEAANRLHVSLRQWQGRKFAGLLDQLTIVLAGTRRVGSYSYGKSALVAIDTAVRAAGFRHFVA